MAIKSTRSVCVFFCVVLHIARVTNGHSVNIYATPLVVFHNLTDSLNVTCRVGEHIIGGSELDISFLSSIALERVDRFQEDYGEVAVFYDSVIRRGWNLPAYASMRGGMNKTAASGYIEVILPFPDFKKSKAAKFRCGVKGYTDSGKTVEVYLNILVKIKNPSFSLLLPYARALLNKLKGFKTVLDSAKNKGLSKVPQVYTGTVKCSGACGCRQIQFDKPYHNTPDVTYAPIGLTVPHDHNVRLTMYIKDLKTTGFKLCGFDWKDTKLKLLHMAWMSFGY